jgi:hypothetical protein
VRVHALWMIVMLVLLPMPAQGQDGIQSLQVQMSELKSLMEEMRAENRLLRQELEQIRQQLTNDEPLQKIEEEQQLLAAKIDEQHQTKVESGSRYRVRLSGMVLANMFSNSGVVDNLDFPSLAVEEDEGYSRGSFGGTLRQSLFGLEVFGPEVRGGRVSGDLQFDFAGGFPYAPDGVSFGLPRLRTGTIRMSWPATTFVAGQDAPFFSPLSPGSIASLGVPPLSYSGNLWGWIPQIRVEHVVASSGKGNLLLQGGILDPLTGELPSSRFRRTPQAGEASRQPAYATRVAWNGRGSGQPLSVGIGGYYSRQNWGFNRNVDGWSANSDWTVPLNGRWEVSGEFYRGRAVAGLGGGIGRSIVLDGILTDPATRIRPVNAFGGWTQVKFRQTERLEWNGAFGQDNVHAKDLRAFPLMEESYLNAPVARNRTSLMNFIYRPRSDLLLSIEYRRLRTSTIYGSSETADHFNLGMGVLF